METHPVRQAMRDFGVSNPIRVDQAFQVYIELCEAMAMTDVEYEHSQHLDLIFLKAKKTCDGPTQVFLPISSTSSVSMDWLSHVQSQIGVPSEDGAKLVLAVVDPDSTVILQEMTQGLVPPSRDKRQRRPVDPVQLLAPEILQHAVQAVQENNN